MLAPTLGFALATSVLGCAKDVKRGCQPDLACEGCCVEETLRDTAGTVYGYADRVYGGDDNATTWVHQDGRPVVLAVNADVDCNIDLGCSYEEVSDIDIRGLTALYKQCL